MIPTADKLLATAIEETGLEYFGEPSFREGLERLVTAIREEAKLNPTGEQILGYRLGRLLVNRLKIEDTYRRHPEIDEQRVEQPLFIVGLPRTGTTALGHLLTLDPDIRSLRLWESSNPVPPPEAETQYEDPRIARTEEGLQAMYSAFPEMKALHFQTADSATECQDLLGMAFRTLHFDGMARVPGYTDWALDCDMHPAYDYHRRTLKLLQWRCPPRQWHLKTPVHLFALDALNAVYPDARFIWTHRHPAEVMGSVCSLIAFMWRMVSDPTAGEIVKLGKHQCELWALALQRGIDFRERVGEARFADVRFDELNRDPVGTVERAYDKLGLRLGEEGHAAMSRWAQEHTRGAHGAHEYALEDYGLDAAEVTERFRFYRERFTVIAPTHTVQGSTVT